MNSLKCSWLLTKSLFITLLQNKRIVILPLMLLFSRVLFYIIGLVFLYFAFPKIDLHSLYSMAFIKGLNHWYYWLLFAIAFFYLNFVAILFNIATIAYIGKTLDGEPYSVYEAFKLSCSRLKYIIEWIMFYPTLGIVIGIFAALVEQVDRVFVYLFRASWQPLRWMSLPSLVFQKKSLLKTMKESGKLLENKWGHPVGRLSYGGLILFLLLMPVALIGVGVGFTLLSVKIKTLIITVILIYIGVLHVLSAVLSNIFQSVIYSYIAFNKVPKGFSKKVLEQIASI